MQNSSAEISNSDLHKVANVISFLARVRCSSELMDFVQEEIIPFLGSKSFSWSVNYSWASKDGVNYFKKLCTVSKCDKIENSYHYFHESEINAPHLLFEDYKRGGFTAEAYEGDDELHQKAEFKDTSTPNCVIVLFPASHVSYRVGERRNKILSLIQKSFIACLSSIAEHEKYTLLVGLAGFFMKNAQFVCIMSNRSSIVDLNYVCRGLNGHVEDFQDSHLAEKIKKYYSRISDFERKDLGVKKFFSTNNFLYKVSITSLHDCKEKTQIVQMTNAQRDKEVEINLPNDYGMTKKEIDVLILVLNGLKSVEIAECLYISINTVKTHLRHIHQKCQTKNKSQLINLFTDFTR